MATAAISEYKWRPLGDPNAAARVNRLLNNARSRNTVPATVINNMQAKYEVAKTKKLANRNAPHRGGNYAVAASGLFGLM
jgi:hypothetical protein